MVDYAKPRLPIDDQIDKLISRGVVIADCAEAANLLPTVGIYRLKGVSLPVPCL